MSDKKPSIIKRLQWRAECMVHSLVEGIASVLPGPWVYRFGECLGWMAWHLMPARRKIVLRNLRIAYAGAKEIAWIEEAAKTSFLRAGANLISGAHTAKLKPSRLAEVIKLENPDLLQESLEQGKGVVLLLAHMGNWELLSRLVHLFPAGSKAGAMYRPLNNPYMDERVRLRRQEDGTRMFSKRDPFHQITGFLRDGGVVGVLVDQRMGVTGDTVRFFGRVTKASPLPSLLARRSKSDVLALSLTTARPGQWKAKLWPVDTPISTDNCMSALEVAMKRSPEDVFWLQERWKLRLGPLHHIDDLHGDRVSDEQKKHRALLWLVGIKSFTGLSRRWLHPDVAYEIAIDVGRELPADLVEGASLHHVESDSPWDLELAKIDERETLPLDFVLGVEDSQPLAAACKKECIPLYIHDQIGVSSLKSRKRRSKFSEAAGE